MKREKDLEPCQAHISLVLNYLVRNFFNSQITFTDFHFSKTVLSLYGLLEIARITDTLD